VKQSDAQAGQGREELTRWQKETMAWLEKNLKENFDLLRKENVETIRRATATSLHGTLRPPSFAKTRPTSASPSALREPEPWKLTSSIRWPRSDFALCSPSAHRTASEMLLLWAITFAATKLWVSGTVRSYTQGSGGAVRSIATTSSQ
jgi:hypothetical protein